MVWGHPNGSTDNTTALNNALTAVPSGGGEIFFPPGTFLFSSAITYNIPAGPFSISFVGSGADVSILYWPSTAGMTVNANSASHSIHIRDVSITTGSNAAYNGLSLNNSVLLGEFSQSDLYRVTFRGNPVAGNYSWATALVVNGLSNVSYDTLLFYGSTSGAGIMISGNASISPYYSIVHNLSKCGFFGLGTSFVYGSYLQGVTISQSNFTNGVTGIFVGTGAVGASQLSLTNSQFNVTGNQIVINAPIVGAFISENLIVVPAENTGVLIESAGSANQSTFVGNNFFGASATESTAIDVLGTSSGTIVTGNIFYNLAVGVNLDLATGWNVQANVYTTVANKVINAGAGNSVGVATD